MRKNHSPWLHQLDKDRVPQKLQADLETDVAIIGAGIAGVSTAFYILKNTDKKVALVEGFKLAHGATGHNAGHIIGVFERGLPSIVEEFGIELAGTGQKAIESAWNLLDEMYTDAGLDIPFSRFKSHAGFSTKEQVVANLKDNLCRKKAGLNIEPVLISKKAPFLKQIEPEYEGLYSVVAEKDILDLLETKVKDYVALTSHQSGCINSALFCEEIVLYLLNKYKDRFAFYENTPIEKIVLHRDKAILDALNHTVTTERVVLCTNGFESITIINETGLDIDAKYHHLIEGCIGYMSGYLEKMNKPPTANAFFRDDIDDPSDPYFYMTRRPYEYEEGNKHNLISIGGPEVSLDEKSFYSYEDGYPDEKTEEIDNFVRKTYDLEQNKKIDYVFTWHGLMGYTKNGIRLVGPEPQNQILLYNLGCNGIGILPSIFGGNKVARHIAGENVERSIFDVPPRDI